MNIFELFGTIALHGTDKFNKDVDGASEKGSKLAGVIGKGLRSAAVAGGAAIAAAATGIGVLTKQAVSAYGEYEQLVGGVETLFKNSSNTVMKYANNAYKTAGLSANQYMETVTSFSASLLQSLGGDTESAAKIADTAITDMSDNANKMGSDMGMIQNAYQGFAKQNYTMLDNLKLGYGGTKEEMNRLLKDAEKLSGQKFDLSSYADIVDAIHVVQTEMGITGTTSKEAASTIQGSIGMAKSAWENFLTGMSDPTQDFSTITNNLVDSVVTVADNIIPRLVETVPRLVDGLMHVMESLATYVPEIVGTLIPPLISGATSIVLTLAKGMPQILETLVPVVLDSLQMLIDAVTEKLGLASVNIYDVIGQIGAFFSDLWVECQDVWYMIGQPIWDMIQNCINIVSDVFSERMPAIKGFVSKCFTDIQSFWNNNLKPCLDAIGNFIENYLAPVFESVFNGLIRDAVDSTFIFIKSLWEDTLKPVFVGITDFLTGVFTLNWKQAWNGVASIIKGIANGIINIIEGMVNGGISALNGLIEGLNKVISLAGKLLGLSVSIPTIPLLNLPRLEEGGVLEKGQTGFLEGNGAEAVVPLDKNKKWISAVASDMNGIIGNGNNAQLDRIAELLETLVDALPDSMRDAVADMRLNVNNREFARMVKAVN